MRRWLTYLTLFVTACALIGDRMFDATSYEVCGMFDRETADNRAQDF